MGRKCVFIPDKPWETPREGVFKVVDSEDIVIHASKTHHHLSWHPLDHDCWPKECRWVLCGHPLSYTGHPESRIKDDIFVTIESIYSGTWYMDAKLKYEYWNVLTRRKFREKITGIKKRTNKG